MKISLANIQENLLKLQKKLSCMGQSCAVGPYNFETQDGGLKMTDSLFSYQICFVRVGYDQVKRDELRLGLVLSLEECFHCKSIFFRVLSSMQMRKA